MYFIGNFLIKKNGQVEKEIGQIKKSG